MKCVIENCSKNAYCKGLCTKHYKRQWRHGNPIHTEIIMNEGKKCSVDGCDLLADSKTFCNKHYQMHRVYGRTTAVRAPAGEGRPRTSAGYVLITVNGVRKYEHIHIAEQALGKPLPPGAIVHHINGIPDDNRPSNLVVCPNQAYHMLLHKIMRDKGIEP